MIETNTEKDGILLSSEILNCVFMEKSWVSLEVCFLFAYIKNIPGPETATAALQRTCL